MRRHNIKEYADQIKILVAAGWTVIDGKKHYKIKSPGGRLLVVSMSPRCPHAFDNFMRDVRNIMREEGNG